ncbi:MAG: CHAT domain-containing protein [Anaerolineales bacterium]|nr:CHAT domain-containing protein [Anaerolineales bacterium]
MRYLNFDLFVGERTAAGYPLRAECASVGQAPAVGQPAPVSAFDPADPGVQAALAALRAGQTPPGGLRALGERLAAALLPGAIGQLLENARSVAAAQDDQGLRLRLRLAPPEWNALPWELLWRPQDDEPLAVSTDTVVTRYLNLKVRVPRLEALRPLRLLVVLPKAEGVALDAHQAALTAAVDEANRRVAPGEPPLVAATWLTGVVTEDAVRAAMNATRPHLVHFVGHGQFSDGQPSLLLTDAAGDPQPAAGSVVAGFFRNYDSVRLVVLNACQGAAADSAQALVGLAPRIAAQGAPAIVAMQWEIFDWAAQQFAAGFYRGLWSGAEAGEVETALTRARAALYDQAPALAVFATPVLFLRAEGERLWEAGEAAETPAATTPPAGRVIHAGQYFEGAVHVDRDFVAGNLTVTQTAGGDIVGRDKITTSSGGGPDPLQAQALVEQFRALRRQITARPPSLAVDGDELQQNVRRVEAEVSKGPAANLDRLGRLLDELAAAASDIFGATTAILTNPRLGLPEALRRVAADKRQAHLGRHRD